MKHLELSISGMHCEACVTKLAAALRAVAGTSDPIVAVGSARVAFDETRVGVRQILDAVRAAGFVPSGFKALPGPSD